MANEIPMKIVDHMMTNDAFSKWLGIEVEEVKQGFCRLKMVIRKEMLNGFYIAHGGISYSLADSALAFASNTHNNQSVSIETSISHIHPCKEGEILTAIAKEISSSNKIGRYEIEVKNGEGLLVAKFRGTVYKTGKSWF